MFDGKAFGAEVVDIVKGFITKALHDIKIDVAGLIQRVDDLELREPVNGTNGKDADPAVIQRMVLEEVAKLPKAKNGENGKDADPQIIAKMVADAVDGIDKPKDGADGTSVTIDDVTPIIAREVTAAIAKLPPAKDGIGLSGAFIDRSNSLVLTLSDGSTRELGVVVGRDGDRVSAEEIAAAVADYLKANPPATGEPGKSFDPAEMQKAIAEAVAKIEPRAPDTELLAKMVDIAVKAYPKPANGKDADPLVIEHMVAEAIAKLPKPENGKDADPVSPDEIRDAVKEYFKWNPVQHGANGKDADPQEIAELISKAVTSAVEALPKAKEPIGFSSSLIDKDGNLVLTRTDGMVCEIGRIVGANGLNGTDGKDADPAIIERMIEDRISIALEDLDNRPQQPDLTIPDDLVDEIAKAAAYLAESPTIAQRSGSRITRTIRTRRDENGYLVGDVIERGM